MFLLREWEINPRKKIWDPAGIRTQDLNNTQMLLPLSHLDHWQRSRRQATKAALPRSLGWIPTDSHSLKAGLNPRFFSDWRKNFCILYSSKLSWFKNFVNISKFVNFCDKNFVITKFSWFDVAPPIFQQARYMYVGHLVTHIQILNFVNVIIVRLITKFTKILCHENLDLYAVFCSL